MYAKLKETYTTSLKKVCIFDIDNTLTHGAQANNQLCPGVQFYKDPGPHWPPGGGTTNEIREVIKECQNQGYDIAIATAESEEEAVNDIQFKFLENINPDIFTPQFFVSDRFQRSCSVVASPYCNTNEYADKTGMYQNIMKHYGIPPNEWKNSVVFDDDMNNLTTASRMGFRVCQASPECGGKYCPQGCGVRKNCLSVLQNPWTDNKST